MMKKNMMKKNTVGLIAILFLFPAGVRAGKSDKRLDIYWVDTEGGAATLIVTPAGQSILIDTGNPGRRDPDRIAKVATGVAKLRQIDFLITTHYHRDHYGGAATLATMLPIKTVYDNGKFKGMPDNPGEAYFGFKAAKRVVVNPGDRLPLAQADGSPPVAFACVGARKSFTAIVDDPAENAETCAEARSKDRDGSDNANSVVMVLDFGPFRFYDGGDITWNQEKKLVCPKNLIGEVDVYQVTHHGLDSSNNPLVLRSLKPRVAIMNNGHRKGCAPEVYTNLKNTKSIQAIYQVHKNLRPDGADNNTADAFIANFAEGKKCRGHYIKLSADPSGKTYTVAIPEHTHKRTYKTKG